VTPVVVGLIVEGQGDALALPPLLRRIAQAAGQFDLSIPQPFRVKRGKFANKSDDFERALQFLSNGSDVIVTVLDSDADCPVTLSQDLLARANKVVGHIPVSVVAAHQEFEAWLLAGVESMRGYRGIRHDASCPENLDSVRSPKGRLEACITSGVYSETVDQAKFACKMDLEMARARSRSFDKFVRDVERLAIRSVIVR
jgi:hypothetical protein